MDAIGKSLWPILVNCPGDHCGVSVADAWSSVVSHAFLQLLHDVQGPIHVCGSQNTGSTTGDSFQGQTSN